MNHTRHTSPVIAVERSENVKTGPVSATYVAQGSCPVGCDLRGAGCYAESGAMSLHTRQLNESSGGMDPLALARAEADAIAGLSGKLPLRLHVVGDCATSEAAATVAAAARVHTAKHGQAAWTYTHAWREVDPRCWDGVNASASCETANDITAAKTLGWSTVVVYPEFTARTKAFVMTDREGTDHRVIPCPQQSGHGQCATCKGLCTDTANLRRHNISVGFALHGARRTVAQRAINEKTEKE